MAGKEDWHIEYTIQPAPSQQTLRSCCLDAFETNSHKLLKLQFEQL